jgi:hypothetical protein
MTLLEAIESVAASIGLPVHYANLEEANYNLDTVVAFPVMILLPFEVKDQMGVSGLLQSKAPFIAYVMDKPDHTATIEVKTREAEVIVENCRVIARKFMYKMYQNEIIDITKPKAEIVYTPSYSQLDKGVHGVVVTTELNFVEGVTGC